MGASIVPNRDERIMAAICHASIVLEPIGLVIPLIIWINQKDKSRYIAFQALQAVAFQLARLIGAFIGIGCYLVVGIAAIFLATPSGVPIPGRFPSEMLPPLVIAGIIILFAIGTFIYAIVGTGMTLFGKDFRYILIGGWVEQFM